MDTSDLSPPPPAEASEDNGSAATGPEAPADPDPASFSTPPEAQEGDLPADFEHLWKAAHDRPQDFTSWTDLLQYCEQEVCAFSARKSKELKVIFESATRF